MVSIQVMVRLVGTHCINIMEMHRLGPLFEIVSFLISDSFGKGRGRGIDICVSSSEKEKKLVKLFLRKSHSPKAALLI